MQPDSGGFAGQGMDSQQGAPSGADSRDRPGGTRGATGRPGARQVDRERHRSTGSATGRPGAPPAQQKPVAIVGRRPRDRMPARGDRPPAKGGPPPEGTERRPRGPNAMAKAPPIYDLMLLLSTGAPDELRAKILSDVEQAISSGEGTIERNDDWGTRSLAYQIEHQTD